MKAPGSIGDFFLRYRRAIVVIAVVIVAGGGAAAYFAFRNPAGDGGKQSGNKVVTEEAVPNLIEKIVFERGDKIWIMNPDGSGQKQLTSTGYDSDPTLSPDGEDIVFARFTSDPNQAVAAGAAPPTSELYIMDSDGGNARRLSPVDWSSSQGWTPMFDIQEGTKWRRRNCTEPSFSESGKKICFVISDLAYQESSGGGMGNYGLSGIVVMELEGDEPSGTYIVCTGGDLYGGESFGNPGFARNDIEIFFTYGAGGGPPAISIEKIDVDGTHRKAVLSCKVGQGAGPDKGYYAFDLSPDGKTMVCIELTIDQSRFKGWLFLADTDGSKRRNVPTDGVTIGMDCVSFSPDGLRLVFANGDEAAPGAYVVNADGNSMAKIAGDVDTPDWGKAVE